MTYLQQISIYLSLIRFNQYIKNLFIFAPLVFAQQFSIENLVNTSISFVLFSIIASSIYIFNDYIDIEEDRMHPTKKFRALASGEVSNIMAKRLIILLPIIPFLWSFKFNSSLFLVLILYFSLNIAYSLKLKHIAIVDIFVLATGFVLRLYAGITNSDIQLSVWIIVITFLLALFLSLAKRRDDVLLSLKGNKVRKSIDGYNLDFVNFAMISLSSVLIVSYILYTVSDDNSFVLDTKYFFLTSFFVIFGVMRYMQAIFLEGKTGDPTKMILEDRSLQVTVLLWLVSFFIVINL